MGEPAHDRRRVTGKADVRVLAHGAAAAVGAYQVAGVQTVHPVSGRHGQRDVLNARPQRGQLVTPPDVDTEIACPLLQQAHHPRLLDQQGVHRVVVDPEEVQSDAREHPAVCRPRRTLVAAEDVIEATHVELPDDLSDKAVSLGFVARPRQPVQHHRPDAGKRELARQQQPVGSGAGDDDVGGFDGHRLPLLALAGSGMPAATSAKPARTSVVIATGGSALT